MNIIKAYQEKYFNELAIWFKEPANIDSLEIEFLIIQLAIYIRYIEAITLKKDVFEFFKGSDKQFFFVSESMARMKAIETELKGLHDKGCSSQEIANALYNFDEQTKKLFHSLNKKSDSFEIEYSKPKVIMDWSRKADEWKSDLNKICKFCRWLHKRRRKLIDNEFVDQTFPQETIDPLEFNLNQTDIVHLFELLSEADIIKEPTDEVHRSKGGFYGKIAHYFTAQGKKPINPRSAKQVLKNKEYKNTPYSKTYYKMLQNLKKTIEQKLKNQSLL